MTARRLLLCCLMLLPLVTSLPTPAAEAPPQPPSGESLKWPRDYPLGEQHLQVFQPQIESWDGTRLGGRAAIALGTAKGAPTYGVAQFSAAADIDKSSGLVQLTDLRIDKVEVPTAPDSAEKVRQALTQRLPKQLTMSLDELQASYAVAQQLDKLRRVAVKNDAPRILFADSPSVLVRIDGEPQWRTVEGSDFQRVLNSRALILRDGQNNCYLQAAGYWYLAQGLEGTWRVLGQPPKALLDAARLAAKANLPDPLLPKDGKKAAKAPAIVLATQPSELIISDGPAQMSPVDGVALLTLSNADHAVFVDPASNTWYVLVSGRWFSAPGDKGPWTYVEGKDLPADFAKISPKDPKANVLVSVPGTPQAKEAAIAANIPQTASVSRSRTSLKVAYDGAPRFSPVEGTALQYAVNTPTPVIEVGSDQFYAVSNGVWFVATGAAGPWKVATEVPAAIYAIPPSSPLYYVTYVHIYSVTPQSVVVGYTPGYLGVVVNDAGTVVYGTGYAYPAYVSETVYYGYPPTYGYGASFALGTLEGFAFGFAVGAIWGSEYPCWGPYWGPWPSHGWNYVNVNQANFYGRWGQGSVTHANGWNAWTGTQWQGSAARGYDALTGAHFQGSRGAGFNPYSQNFAAGRQGSFANPATGISGAGRSTVVGNRDSGDYAAGRQVAGHNAQTGRTVIAEKGVSGNVYDGSRSTDSRGLAYNRRTGSGVAWNNGDVYAGHDGNIYQRTDDGWQKHTDNGWQPVQGGNGELRSQLEQQRQSRVVGQQRFGQTQRQWGGGGHFGGGGRLRR
ncbi:MULTISPECIES: carbohydrate-binding family V/XII [Pseudomonas]|uniref:carbohydrate-binding family V/XII n=1 Tax=Pseudomonas TaxID=286 RepID=UPI0004D7541A|nr:MULTISPECIES: carbohydrate-binding family V/XII [Pseudomonas]KES21021.1 carbohydrate-binding family V/XII [Pseudomonas sp. AAC]MBH3432993.1 carbohydrate-binding family V/XII [Pseudomonas citronellolis]